MEEESKRKFYISLVFAESFAPAYALLLRRRKAWFFIFIVSKASIS
jgi:hypothetical protein